MSSGARLVVDEWSDADVAAAATAFRSATPFPHLVIEDAVATGLDALVESWPDADWPGWRRFTDAYQAGKSYCADIERMPAPLAAVIRHLSEPTFLARLGTITGIDGLIPDPYLEGGGLHESDPGGVLAPHTDFHLYRRLDLHRRINLLLYLNPGWRAEDGGGLELWEPGAASPARTIVPALGTCVIFQTDHRSIHGFSTPVAGGTGPRRSIALYYYTALEAPSYAGDTTTYWRRHGAHRGVDRARLGLYRALVLVSRAVAGVAHRVNPNLARRRGHGDGPDAGT